MAFARLREKFRTAVLTGLAAFGLLAPFNAHAQRSHQNNDGWKVRPYASHAFASYYFSSDLRIQTTRYDLTVENYEWKARNGNEWFYPKTWFAPGNTPLKMIDEPPNTYGIAVEKGRHSFHVSSFHLKFLQQPDQVKRAHGSVDGQPFDQMVAIEGGYGSADPSAIHLLDPEQGLGVVYNQNTYMSLEWEVGYSYRVTLMEGRKGATISYFPGAAIGIHTGQTMSGIRNETGGYDTYTEKFGIQGFGGSISNRLEWRGPRDRFGMFFENKVALYSRSHALLEGKQKFLLGYTANSVGFSVKVFDSGKKKNRGGCPAP